MLSKNQQLTVHITDFNHDLQGVARYDGMVIFVPYALPGEEVQVQIIQVRKNLCIAKLLNVLVPSPHRVAPACPHFYRCGGCSLQHLAYQEGLRAKQKLVADLYPAIGKCSPPVRPALGMDDPWAYRNKTSAPVQASADGVPVCGFYAPRSHRLIEIASCPIAMPQSAMVQKLVLRWMRENNISAYDEARHEGLVRHIVSRTNRAGQTMVLLAINGRALPKEDALVSALKNGLPGYYSLSVSINQKRGNTILGEGFTLLDGQNDFEETLLGLRFHLSPVSFFQVNPRQTEALYQTAIDLAALTGTETMLDLYCGAGTIGLCFAKQARQVIGVEIIPEAVQDAQKNARRNQIHNAAFHCGKAEDLLPDLLKSNSLPDVVMLDPPRKGCEAHLLHTLAACGVKKILYISCHPATQARDIAILGEHGYTAALVQPVDMFCHTSAIESVALITKA